jgi:hypothetical protein
MTFSRDKLSIISDNIYVYDAEESETLDLLLASGYFDGITNNSKIIIYNNKIISGLTLTIDATGTAYITGSASSLAFNDLSDIYTNGATVNGANYTLEYSSVTGGYTLDTVTGGDGSGDISFISGITADGTTDNSAVIQAAIDAAVSAGGGTLYLPSGVIAVASPLVITGNGVILCGQGMLATTLKAIGNGTKVLRVGSLSTSTSGKSADCQLRDCGFEGTTGSTVEVVEVLGVTRFIASSCKFFQGNNALSVRNADQSVFYNNIIRVNQNSKTALRLIQGETDDVTTCAFLGGIIEVLGTNSTCVKFEAEAGSNTNEFNNIVFGDALKMDGNNIAGNTGVQYINAGATAQDEIKVILPAFEEDGSASAVGAYQKVICKFNIAKHFLGTLA